MLTLTLASAARLKDEMQRERNGSIPGERVGIALIRTESYRIGAKGAESEGKVVKELCRRFLRIVMVA